MLNYMLRPLIYMVFTLVALSVVIFIIQLPPDDYLTTYVNSLQAQGMSVDVQEMVALRARYGLDASPIEQYWLWISNFIRGDRGRWAKNHLIHS